METYQSACLCIAEANTDPAQIQNVRGYFFRVMRNEYIRRVSCPEYPTDPAELRHIIMDYTPDTDQSDNLDKLELVLSQPSKSKRDFYTKQLVISTLRIKSVSKAAEQLKINRSSIYHAFRKIRQQINSLST